MAIMASRMWRRYTKSSGVIDHHSVTIYCIGKVEAHGVFGDEIHLHGESPRELVLDPDDRKEAFYAGKPD